jgi:hypothetical protein
MTSGLIHQRVSQFGVEETMIVALLWLIQDPVGFAENEAVGQMTNGAKDVLTDFLRSRVCGQIQRRKPDQNITSPYT